ncbi:MAG: hypothetical protein AB8G77_26270 [Rhodothermales bacterium]
MYTNSANHEERFWTYFNNLGSQNRIHQSLYLLSMSEVDIQPLKAIIRKHKIEIREKTDTKVWLVIVDTMGDSRLDPINKEAISWGIQLLVFKPTGLEIEYALFNNDSACWSCYKKRDSLLDGVGTYLKKALPNCRPLPEPVYYNKPTVSLAFNWIMLEIERLLSEPTSHPLAGKLRAIALDKMESSDHVITQLAHCTSCQDDNSKSDQFPSSLEIRIDREMITSD